MKPLGIFILFLFLLITMGFLYLAFLQVQINSEKLWIKEEEHINNLYSIYQNNISVCASQAKEEGQEYEYIVKNCIKPVNDSPIGFWLTERGYGFLLEEAR